MKRVSLFVGHYGSGKTNVAINYALMLRKQNLPVVVADLDIVNPYFRTKDSLSELRSAGIDFISSEYAGSNVDFPALPGELYSLVDNTERYAVLDVGGDDRGALALGRYRDKIVEENNYDMFVVINRFRPLTKTPELLLGVMNEIETACNMKFTAIINNSNLGPITTAQDVISGIEYTDEVRKLTGLPVAYTTMTDNVYRELLAIDSKSLDRERVGELFPIKLQSKIFEEVEV